MTSAGGASSQVPTEETHWLGHEEAEGSRVVTRAAWHCREDDRSLEPAMTTSVVHSLVLKTRELQGLQTAGCALGDKQADGS